MAGLKLFGPTHALLTTSLRLRAARHEVLAANVANADTPDYRPRDLKFDGVLQAITRGESQPSSMQGGQLMLVSTNPRHLGSSVRNVLVTENTDGEGKLDQNRVDLDREMTQLAENGLLYETSATLLSRTLSGLRYAISEGRG